MIAGLIIHFETVFLKLSQASQDFLFDVSDSVSYLPKEARTVALWQRALWFPYIRRGWEAGALPLYTRSHLISQVNSVNITLLLLLLHALGYDGIIIS